jgi:hypothetical protein
MRPGKAVLMGHRQPRLKVGMFRPMSDPTMRGEIGFPRNGPAGPGAWPGGCQGCRAGGRGAAGAGGGAGGT